MKVFSGHQPNFLPYLGVFYKMHRSDVFVLDDDVQYSRTGLHNANFIKVGGQKYKMIVPTNARMGDLINEVRICNDQPWVEKLLKTIRMNYGKADHFEEGFEFISRYLNSGYEFLCDLNIDMIKEISKKFDIKTEVVIASKDVPTDLKKNERNIFQCVKLGGDVYYSGEGGKEYNDIQGYKKHGIEVVYTNYQPVQYKQLARPFIPNLSVLDYIMNVGFVLPEDWN